MLLAEKLGTKYLTEDFLSPMLTALNESTKTNEVIDLAGCKFGPLCEQHMRGFYGKLQFINNASVELNELLKHNCKAARLPNISTVAIPCNIVDQADVVQWFNTVDVSVAYDLSNCKINSLRTVAMAIMLIMRYPNIMINMGNYADVLFRQARLDWQPGWVSHDTYSEVIGSAVVERKVVDGKVYIPGVGTVSETLYATDYNCLPAVFGKVALMKEPKYRAEFENLWSASVKVIMQSGTRSMTMKDYIETGVE